MNIFWRRLTYSLFLTIFFIVAPLLILYSLGYRYNFNTNNIEKNGAFYIKSYPKNADIFINNEKNNKKTPHQIVNIKPATYQLKISKENYLPWEKELTVYEGETTFVENIVLFLEEQKKEILGPGADNILLNKKGDKYAYFDKERQLWITDIEKNKNYNIYQFKTDYDLIDWSVNNQDLLLKRKNNYYLFNINQKKIELINIENITKALFDNNYLWYLKDNILKKYNLQNQQENIILEDINDFIIKDNYLIIQKNNIEGSNILHLEKESLKEIQNIANLNLGILSVLKVDDKSLIFKLGSKLYIKYTWKDIIIIPATLVKIYGNFLLISNGYEVWLYNYKDDWQEIIDRSSKIISDIIWHPNGSYFLNEINQETIISELDTRDKRNTISLFNNPFKKYYLFNKKGNKLFILTPQENFSLTIQ